MTCLYPQTGMNDILGKCISNSPYSFGGPEADGSTCAGLPTSKTSACTLLGEYYKGGAEAVLTLRY